MRETLVMVRTDGVFLGRDARRQMSLFAGKGAPVLHSRMVVLAPARLQLFLRSGWPRMLMARKRPRVVLWRCFPKWLVVFYLPGEAVLPDCTGNDRFRRPPQPLLASEGQKRIRRRIESSLTPAL